MNENCVEVGVCKPFTTPVGVQYELTRPDYSRYLMDQHGQYSYKSLDKDEIQDYLTNIQ